MGSHPVCWVASTPFRVFEEAHAFSCTTFSPTITVLQQCDGLSYACPIWPSFLPVSTFCFPRRHVRFVLLYNLCVSYGALPFSVNTNHDLLLWVSLLRKVTNIENEIDLLS